MPTLLAASVGAGNATLVKSPAGAERYRSAGASIAMLRVAIILLPCAILAAPAVALESLIPSPYPSGAPGAAPLDPRTPEPGGPQQLMRDPYPQILGDDAQGNPPIARARHHQHLTPTIHQRKYRVDRH
jgi:hypothetical protein